MNSFGGTSLCARCDRPVYAAEHVIGPGRKVYHKPCLTCTSCNKRLDSHLLVEHDSEPYCRACHLRNFSTRDLRHQNLSPTEESPTIPTSAISPLASGSISSPVGRPIVSSPTGRLWGPTKPLNPTSTGGGARFGSFGGGVDCPRCKKAVYFAEQVNAVGKKWHKACLRCTECGTSLDSTRLADKDGEPFCRSCYSKLHGPQGAGYALIGRAG